MENIDWKRKLSSRKFWIAIGNFITMLIVSLGGSKELAVQITGLVLAGGTVIAYILAEGWADAAGAGAPIELPEIPEIPEIPPDDDLDDE